MGNNNARGRYYSRLLEDDDDDFERERQVPEFQKWYTDGRASGLARAS